MAKNIPNVDILTETFDTWVNRTNSVIDVIRNEVLTANSTLGETGSPLAPLNSRLWGAFTANTLTATTSLSIPNSFSANQTSVTISMPLLINGSVGSNGQVLTSNGTNQYWSTLKVDAATNGGLIGGTSTGTMSVKAGPGINVDSFGVSVNMSYISEQLGGGALEGYTWASPGALGTGEANTGTFTTVTSESYRLTGISVDNFILNSSQLKLSGYLDSITPGNGISDTNGGVRIRSRGTGRSVIQFTNQTASSEFGNLSVDSSGKMYWTGSLHISTNNANGGGLILSDDGDFVDLSNGYGTFRFTNGIDIYSGNKSGSSAIRLKSNGDIEAEGDIYSNGTKLVSLGDFTNGSGVNPGSTIGSTGNWCKLPNGMLLQWGTIPANQDSYSTLYFPQAFTTSDVAVTCSGGVKISSGGGENPATVTSVSSTSFQIWTTENVNTTAWWVAMGF